MKRCIICGNVDDDNSTVCSTCGNPYVDMSAQASEVDEGHAAAPEAGEEQDAVPEEVESEKEAASEQPETEESQPEEPQRAEEEQPKPAESPQAEQAKAEQAVPEPREPQEAQAAQEGGQGAAIPGQMSSGRPPRRMRSGPQIYGQTEGVGGNPSQYSNQGMIRRDVPPRSAGAGRPMGQTPGGTGRPMGQTPGGTGRPTGQMSGGVGRPMGQMPGGSSRPMGQMPGGAGRFAGQDYLVRSVMEIARKAMRSPLFFLIVLLNTVSVAASIAAIFLNELNYSQAVRLLNDANLPQQVSGYVSSATKLLQNLQNLDTGTIIANIALHIPSILFCLGLWLIFIAALRAKENMSGVGFGFAKAAVIIRMVVACVVMLAVLIVTVTVVVAAWVSKEQPVIIMAVVMLVVTIIIVMMIIMYYFAYLGTLKTCRVNGNTGESYGRLSAYLAVLLIILALPEIVGLLSGIVNMEISNIVGSVAKMGWMILLAVWIFLYRGRMSELEG